jgi:hypothetical protein
MNVIFTFYTLGRESLIRVGKTREKGRSFVHNVDSFYIVFLFFSSTSSIFYTSGCIILM